MIFPREVLSLLFKNSRLDIGAALLCVLAPAILFSSILINVNTFLEASGRVRVPLYSMLVGSAVKICVSYILIAHSDLGILGAPIGTVMCYVVSLMISLIIYARGFKRLPPIIETNIFFLAASFIIMLFCRMLLDSLPSGDISFIIVGLLGGLIYLAFVAFYTLILSGKKKQIGKIYKFVI